MTELAAEIGDILNQKKLTVGTVESATGGLISSLLTDVAGSSDYYKGSVIAYSNEIKVRISGVRPETISANGAVSSQTAEEMALGGAKALGVDICVSDTGIAGPGGATAQKPVGLFYIGLAHNGKTMSKKHIFSGSREENKRTAAEAALKLLRDYLITI